MQKAVYFCDICGKEINQWRIAKFKTAENKELRIMTDDGEGADICHDCLSLVENIGKNRSKK